MSVGVISSNIPRKHADYLTEIAFRENNEGAFYWDVNGGRIKT
jgi:hypothetical protein